MLFWSPTFPTVHFLCLPFFPLSPSYPQDVASAQIINLGGSSGLYNLEQWSCFLASPLYLCSITPICSLPKPRILIINSLLDTSPTHTIGSRAHRRAYHPAGTVQGVVFWFVRSFWFYFFSLLCHKHISIFNFCLPFCCYQLLATSYRFHPRNCSFSLLFFYCFHGH